MGLSCKREAWSETEWRVVGGVVEKGYYLRMERLLVNRDSEVLRRGARTACNAVTFWAEEKPFGRRGVAIAIFGSPLEIYFFSPDFSGASFAVRFGSGSMGIASQPGPAEEGPYQ